MRFSPWFSACFHKPLTLAAQELLYIISFRLSSSFFKFFQICFLLGFRNRMFSKALLLLYYMITLLSTPFLPFICFFSIFEKYSISRHTFIHFRHIRSLPAFPLMLTVSVLYIFIFITYRIHRNYPQAAHVAFIYFVRSFVFSQKIMDFSNNYVIILLYYYYELLGLE